MESYVTERVKEYGGYEVETPIMYDSDIIQVWKVTSIGFLQDNTIYNQKENTLFLRFAACFGQFLNGE